MAFGLTRYVMFYKRLFAQSLAEAVAQQRDNAFLYVPLCFALGIAVYFSLYREPSLDISFYVFLISLCAWAGIFAVKRDFKRDFSAILRPLLFAVLLFTFGFYWAGYSTAQLHTMMLTKKDIAEIEGRIENISFVNETLSKVIIGDIYIEGKSPARTPQRIKLRSYHFSRSMVVGSKIKVLAALTPPARPIMPHGFDFQRHSYFDGIGAIGYTLGKVQILSPPKDNISVGRFFGTLRQGINARIDKVLDTHNAALVKALITGDRGGISKNDYDALRVAGLAHLLAISGLHIGLVSGFVFFFLRFGLCLFPYIALHYPIKKIAAFVALWAALFYMLLAGATIPTQRAALMSCLFFTAIILDRRAVSLRLVALAAFVVLLIKPYSLLSPSFQLSFAAVTALVSFYEWRVRQRITKQLRFMKEEREALPPSMLFENWRHKFWAKPFIYIVGIMLTSLIAGLATSLFSIYHFGQYNPYGLLGNVLALPVVSLFVMPFAVIALVLWPFAWLSSAALYAMGWGLNWVMFVAYGIRSYPYSSAALAQMPFAVFICLVLAFIALTLMRGRMRGGLSIVFVLVALVLFSLQKDRLLGVVDESAQSVVLYENNQITLYGVEKPSAFVTDQIAEFYGLPEDSISYDNRAVKGQYCAAQYCLLNVKGQKIALVFDMALYHKFCAREDIAILIVSEGVSYNQECDREGLITLNFFDMWRYGSYAVFWDSKTKNLHVKSVEGARGIRPWTTRWQRKIAKTAQHNE